MLNNLKDRNKMQINIHEQNINGETSTFITHVHFTKDFLELVNFLTMNFLFFAQKKLFNNEISENCDKTNYTAAIDTFS